jgi:hypothetical protein
VIAYSTTINKIRIDESIIVLRGVIAEVFRVDLSFDKLKCIIEKYYKRLETRFEESKKELKSKHNCEQDDLYQEIELLFENVSDKVILFIKSTICRLHEWFLLSNKELGRLKTPPPILDIENHVYKNFTDKYNFYKQIENNRDNISDYIKIDVPQDIRKLLDKADTIFKKNCNTFINSFKTKLDKLRSSSQEIYSRITNKSAPFYGLNIQDINSYVENLFHYDTNKKYGIYKPKKYKFIKLPSNYDYIKCNRVKNRSKGDRWVFFTNSQVNSFLKPFNDIARQSFLKMNAMAVYDQDKGVRDVVNLFSQNIDKEISALSLDVSKYSDTLPISLFHHVLQLLGVNSELSIAICECLNLPILFDNKLHDHNATCQGLHFDFFMITIINYYVQVFISVLCGKKILGIWVCGDDSVLILEGSDHKEYARLGRLGWAICGCKVNESKALSCNQNEGILSFLKYTAAIKNGKIVNISGFTPGLYLKNIISYNRINSIFAYMKKSLYVDKRYIPTNFINYYHTMFKDTIKNAYIQLKISQEDIDIIYNNAPILIQERPYMLGGAKEYDLSLKEERIALIKDIRNIKKYYDSILFDKNNTTLPLLEALCLHGKFSIAETCLEKDYIAFVDEEYSRIYAKFMQFLNKSHSFIEGDIADLKKVLENLKNLNDRRFDKYKPGRPNIDRRTDQNMEDFYLISPEDNDLSPDYMCLFSKSRNEELKLAQTIIVEMMHNTTKELRFAKPQGDNIMLDLERGLTIACGNLYSTDKYYSVDEYIQKEFNKVEAKVEVITKIVKACSKEKQEQVKDILVNNTNLVEKILKETYIMRKRSKILNEVVEKAIENVVTKTINKTVQEASDKIVRRQMLNITKKNGMRLLEIKSN